MRERKSEPSATLEQFMAGLGDGGDKILDLTIGGITITVGVLADDSPLYVRYKLTECIRGVDGGVVILYRKSLQDQQRLEKRIDRLGLVVKRRVVIINCPHQLPTPTSVMNQIRALCELLQDSKENERFGVVGLTAPQSARV